MRYLLISGSRLNWTIPIYQFYFSFRVCFDSPKAGEGFNEDNVNTIRVTEAKNEVNDNILRLTKNYKLSTCVIWWSPKYFFVSSLPSTFPEPVIISQEPPVVKYMSPTPFLCVHYFSPLCSEFILRRKLRVCERSLTEDLDIRRLK